MSWTRVLTRLAVFPAIAAASLATAPIATAQTSTGRITGTVTDRVAGAPIANVTIAVTNTALAGRTGPDGRFTIADVPAGNQRLRAARIGYAPTDQLVNIGANQTVTVNLALSTASVTLDQVVV